MGIKVNEKVNHFITGLLIGVLGTTILVGITVYQASVYGVESPPWTKQEHICAKNMGDNLRDKQGVVISIQSLLEDCRYYINKYRDK